MSEPQLGMCDFSLVEELPNGQFRHTARCGLVRVVPSDGKYNKRCNGTCIPGFTRQPIPAPGFALMNLLHRLGVQARSNCDCAQYAQKMNGWGIDGCRERRAEIVDHLRTQYRTQTVGQIMRSAVRAISTGFAIKLNPLDLFGSLVDEAIRLAEISVNQNNSKP